MARFRSRAAPNDGHSVIPDVFDLMTQDHARQLRDLGEGVRIGAGQVVGLAVQRWIAEHQRSRLGQVADIDVGHPTRGRGGRQAVLDCNRLSFVEQIVSEARGMQQRVGQPRRGEVILDLGVQAPYKTGRSRGWLRCSTT